MENDLIANPAEPVVENDGSYGGYADIARMLNAMHQDRERPFSRQLVQRWYTHRDYNGFPESHPVRTRTGKVRTLFKLDDVKDWHTSYRLHRRSGGKPPIETIPLFQISAQGVPVY